jgi:protease-4
MEEMRNSIYFNNFVPKVAKGRGKSEEEVNSVGQGRVWTGAQAKQNGLIDEFGGLEKAIEIAKGLANLPAEKDVRRVNFPEPRPFFETIFGGGVSAETNEQKAQKALINSLPEDVRRTFRYASMLDRMKRGEAMMMMPFELEIK